MRSIIVTVTAVGTALAAAGGTLAAQPDLLRHPTAALSAAGPDSFTVRVFTTKGPVALLSRRAWSPRGSDRFYHLVRLKFYDRSVFYRVLPNYIAYMRMAASAHTRVPQTLLRTPSAGLCSTKGTCL